MRTAAAATRFSSGVPHASRLAVLMAAVLVGACANVPSGPSGPSGPARLTSPSQAELPRVGTEQDCQDNTRTSTLIKDIERQLQPHGLQLLSQCNRQGWVMQVRVLEGKKARQVVRGPLADGQPVDMGTPAGKVQTDAAYEAKGFSPDVQFNRHWLRTLLSRHEFESQPGAWWHYRTRSVPFDGVQARQAQ